MKLCDRVMEIEDFGGLTASKRLIKGNLILVNGVLETDVNREVFKKDNVRKLKKWELKDRGRFRKKERVSEEEEIKKI